MTSKSNRIYYSSGHVYTAVPESQCKPLPRAAWSVCDGIFERANTWMGKFPPFNAKSMQARVVISETLVEVVATTSRHRTHQSRRCFSRMSILAMVFKLAMGAQKNWRRMKGYGLLGQVELGMEYKDACTAEHVAQQHHRADQPGHTLNLSISPDTPKKVIGLDYGMSDGKTGIWVRCGFLYCTLKRPSLAVKLAARKPPDQLIVLFNRAQVCAVAGFPNRLD